MEKSQQISYEKNQQDGTEPDTSTPAGTPAAMAVVSATAAQNQQQKNNQN
jgi:hypothetical protein